MSALTWLPLWEQSPVLKQAYDLREALTTIFDTLQSKAAGVQAIKRWRKQVVASGLTCYTPFLTLLDTWLDLVANYFCRRLSSGFVEGLNNKMPSRFSIILASKPSDSANSPRSSSTSRGIFSSNGSSSSSSACVPT
jgi:Transposase